MVDIDRNDIPVRTANDAILSHSLQTPPRERTERASAMRPAASMADPLLLLASACKDLNSQGEEALKRMDV